MGGKKNTSRKKGWLTLLLSFIGLKFILKKFKLDE